MNQFDWKEARESSITHVPSVPKEASWGAAVLCSRRAGCMVQSRGGSYLWVPRLTNR
jgi:hypothetical protein